MQLVHVGLLLTGARNPPGEAPESQSILSEDGTAILSEDGTEITNAVDP